VLNWSGLSRSESVAIGLALAIAALAAFQVWVLIHLLRQNGRLLLRIEALETRSGAPAELPAPGLPMNNAAPHFSLKNPEGETVTFGILQQQGKPLLLFFSEPGCGACDAIFPELSQWQREYRDRLLIVPISRGEAKVNRAKTEKYGVEHMLLQADREVANAYRVDGVPSAVLVTDGQVSSPLAVGGDAIRGLVTRAVLPPSLKKGDPVPSLKLHDLNGQTLDVASLRGRRTLILFWNPSCGFCQQMREDVIAFEVNPPENAPDLVIISAGSAEDNREQNFRSRVLLDPYFAASQVFNSGGTPSAVLLDERGIVASEVAAGAPEVLELAGAASNTLS